MVETEVISFLKTNGPSLPVEIGKSIGYNSFVTKAILLELINKGLIRKSKRPIGGSLVYYVQEHVNKMRERIYNDIGIPDKKVLKKLEREGQVLMSELTPHERAFLKLLRDFITVERKGDDYVISHYAYDSTKARPVREPVKVPVPKEPEIKPINRELRLFENPPKVKKKVTSDFDNQVQQYINGMGEIISSKKVKAGTEYDYELKITKPFPQELFVKAKKKKSITEADLSVVYTEALRQKKPALLITNGKLSKKAQKWKKENVGELVRVVQLK